MIKPARHFVVADDHPLFRGALCRVLRAAFAEARIDEAGSFDEITAALAETGRADLIILEPTLPGAQGFSGLALLRAELADTPVVVVSDREDAATIRGCLASGAAGYVPKSRGADTVGLAVEAVLAGRQWIPSEIDDAEDDETVRFVDRLATLTPQQMRVLMKLSAGLLNKQIAHELGVSEATIKAHVSTILQKLSVDSRTQAVIVASKFGAGLAPLSDKEV